MCGVTVIPGGNLEIHDEDGEDVVMRTPDDFKTMCGYRANTEYPGREVNTCHNFECFSSGSVLHRPTGYKGTHS